MQQSAERHGLCVDLRGHGEAWEGYHQKVRAFRASLESWPGDHLALFLDAYDTLLLAGEQRIVEVFEATGADILISAEAGLWPDRDDGIAARYPTSVSPFRFANSGVYMGRVAALRNFLAKADRFSWGEVDALGRRHPDADDQRLLTSLFLSQPGAAKLDHEQRLCSNLFSCKVDQYRIFEHGVENEYTGSASCVLHGNGAHGAAVLERLLVLMGERSGEIPRATGDAPA